MKMVINTEIKTRSGRIIIKPQKWEPDEVCEDDYAEDEYDEEEDDNIEEDTDDEEDDEEEDDVGSLKDFVVEDEEEDT